MTGLHLHGTTEPRNKWVRVFPDFEVPYTPIVVILLMVVLAIAFKTADGRRLDNQAWGIASRTGMTDQNGRELKSAKNYKHWMDVIDELREPRTRQARGSNRANGSGATALWLKSIRDRGTDVVIEGMAVSSTAVDEMISNLRSTGYFSNIEIVETYQDDSKNKARAFKFQLTCQVDASKS